MNFHVIAYFIGKMMKSIQIVLIYLNYKLYVFFSDIFCEIIQLINFTKKIKSMNV